MSSRFAAAAASAVLAFCACAASAAPTPRAQPEQPVREEMLQAFALVGDGRCEEALPILRRNWARKEFKLLDPAAQGIAYELAGICEAVAGRNAASLELLDKADKIAGLHDFGLQALFYTSVAESDRGRAVTALERLEAPEDLEPVETQTLTSLALALNERPQDRPLRLRLFAALDRLDFKPKEPFETFDWHWADYAGQLHADDPTTAARVAARVTDPRVLIGMRLDARFAPQADADPGRFDLRAATEGRLAADRATAEAHPDLLVGPVQVANSLRMLGRSEEALAVLDAALARTAPYADAEDQLNWARNERAWALEDLGRYAEAEAAMREAAGTGEVGAVNISQTINLASMLMAHDRAEEALAALKPFDGDMPVSEYGVMWVMETRACAYAALNRRAELRKTLSWMAAREDDNPAAHTRARLCADDLDGAAAAYVRRLADPEQRAEALIALSEFEAPPARPPHTGRLVERLAKVKARADVKAAVARVGRTERVNLRATYWGDV